MSARVALITGASRGIGLAIAQRLVSDGFAVAVSAEEPIAVDAIDASLRVVADLTAAGAATELVENVVDRLGRLDVLVNNAGLTLARSLRETGNEDLDKLVELNIKAPWQAIRAAAPHLSRNGTSAVVNISSPHANRGLPDHSVYAATKGGLEAMTRQLAIELAPAGIRVNAVRPGLTDVQRLRQDPWFASGAAARQVPLQRVAAPRDIAAAVSFLVGPDASYVSGIVLPVDGALGARMALRWGSDE